MDPYEREARGDPAATLALYDWNIRVAGAFFEDLGAFEVLLRNAIDGRMRARCQKVKDAPPWYDQVALQERARQKLDEAKERVGTPSDQDKTIAELTFGFWRYLLSSSYQASIWPTVQYAFHDHTGRPPTRLRTEHVVGNLYDLRNRIAHHEPIFGDLLEGLHAQLLEACGWVCPDSRSWIETRSRVPEVLGVRP